MALIRTEGFGISTSFNDFLTYGLLSSIGVYGIGGTAIINGGVTAPFGDNYLKLSGLAGISFAPLPDNYTSFFVGFRANVANPGVGTASPVSIIFTDANGNAQFRIDLQGYNGIIVVSTGVVYDLLNGFNGGAVIGTSPPAAFSAGAWFYLEVGATIGVSGSVTIRINSIPIMSLTGVDTKGASGVITMNRISVLTTSGGARSDNIQNTVVSLAHHYFCDDSGPAPQNTFLGDIRVQTLLPNTAGDLTQFTPVGGAANWQNAATVPPNPTVDYNTAATVGSTDLFNTPSMSALDNYILGVQVKALCAKSDAGPRTIATVIKSGTTTAQGTVVAPGTSSEYLVSTYSTDPDTGLQWTQAAVDAAQVGYTIVS